MAKDIIKQLEFEVELYKCFLKSQDHFSRLFLEQIKNNSLWLNEEEVSMDEEQPGDV